MLHQKRNLAQGALAKEFRRVASWFILILLLALELGIGATHAASTIQSPKEFRYSTFQAWKEACAKLPKNRQLRRVPPAKELLSLDGPELMKAVDGFLELSATSQLSKPSFWFGPAPKLDHFLDTTKAYFSTPGVAFQPFAQRAQLAAGTTIFLHGDFHGDIHSLLSALTYLESKLMIKDFKISDPSFNMVFLGDYTDRGMYGSEVLYTVLRLKVANPNQVFLIRGNHEDVQLITSYGFAAEAQFKFGRTIDLRRIARVYDFMPVVLYVQSGDTVIQCNHGGMEPGYDPIPFLSSAQPASLQCLSSIKRAQFLNFNNDFIAQLNAVEKSAVMEHFKDFVPETPTTPSVIGFMWNDFSLVRGEAQFSVDPGRALVFGDQFSRRIMETRNPTTNSIHAVFRAHQHSGILNPMMKRLIASKGLFRHWQEKDGPQLLTAPVASLTPSIDTSQSRPIPKGSVWTFNVSPDSVYGEGCGFNHDTFGLLKTAATAADWRIEVVNLVIPF